jgi:hypothetical protein
MLRDVSFMNEGPVIIQVEPSPSPQRGQSGVLP